MWECEALIKISSYKSNPLCCVEAIREQFNEETFSPDAYFSQETDETSAGFASVDPHSEGNLQCLFQETLRLETMRQFPRNRLKLLLKMLELSWNATPEWVLLGRFQGPPSVGSECCSPYPLLCSALVLYICSSATLNGSSAEVLFLGTSATDLIDQLCPKDLHL